MEKNVLWVWVTLRILMGWTFVWAFTDKMFGLGFATKPGSAWLDGASPTYGFLSYATKGPFAELYQSLANSELVAFLFMGGLLFVGVTLLFGVLVRLGAIAGFFMYVMFYTAGFIPPEHNPFIDEHIINAVIMVGLFYTVPSTKWGLGRWWQRQGLVRRFSILK